MNGVTIPKIIDRLKELPPEKLRVVYDFVSFLAERQLDPKRILESSESYQTMLASQEVLSKDWNRAEEDEAWRDL
jgi:hypothetical protein